MMKNLVNHKNILVGATSLNELVFANISIRENKTFSVSFSLVTPTKIDNEYLYESFTSMVESLPKEDLYDLCEEFNCTPSKLIDTMFYYTSPEEILDLSLFPEQVQINEEDTWVFQSVGVGQCETRDLMSKYIDEDAYMRLMLLWDNYHLQTIDDDTIQEVEKLIEKLNEVDSIEWITDYIEECYYR